MEKTRYELWGSGVRDGVGVVREFKNIALQNAQHMTKNGQKKRQQFGGWVEGWGFRMGKTRLQLGEVL